MEVAAASIDRGCNIGDSQSTRGLSQLLLRLASLDNTSALAALRLARELLRASSETLTEAAELAIQSGLPDDEDVVLCDILSTAARHVSKTTT